MDNHAFSEIEVGVPRRRRGSLWKRLTTGELPENRAPFLELLR